MNNGKSMDGLVVTAPLLALSVEAQVMLSSLLNPVKIIPTETNLPRDWRGIAELSNVPAEKMSLFEGKPDPFKEIFNFLCGSGGIRISVDDLKAFLGVVDRFDVLEDVTPILDRDITSYKNRVSEMELNRNVETLSTKQDSAILTFEDAARAQNKLPLCRYDAFILYSEDDSEFATEIVRRMEAEYNLKLCSKDRDLLPGLRFEHEVIGNMIEARCNRLLVIFSPSFLESNANQFLVSYAQAVALGERNSEKMLVCGDGGRKLKFYMILWNRVIIISCKKTDTRSRKIIPCVYKKCELPPSVRYSFCIDYNRSGKLWNFWDKLSQSLAVASSANSQISVGGTPAIKQSNVNHQITVTKDVDDLEWWDANKPDKLVVKEEEEVPTKPFTDFDDNSSKVVLDDRYDAMSINSQAQLLPGASSSSNEKKSSKWLSKIMSPMNRKKRGDKEKSKQKPIAE